jgi:hypothetical protein
VLHISGAGASLARDPDLLFLSGIESGLGEPGLRVLLMRQLLRASSMALREAGEGALELRFAPAP